ncbi:hypothetical protein E3N88_41578 [Mikania micrantha]|uniref:Uncharacterized protein n=1 Tax=Mikania micrantha TaxID=192012 RepID=A0A5N6LK87_9ASTR|nr:hypothetical protein E3N88_41578 [Mikania micrantha]
MLQHGKDGEVATPFWLHIVYEFLRKGYLIVSPLTDRFIDFNSRLEFAHRVALISDEIYQSTKESCRGNYVYPDPNNNLCLDNLQRFDEAATKITLDAWANEKEVQEALHVREVCFHIAL